MDQIKKVSWARKQIALQQLETQRRVLRQALVRVEIEMRPESGGQAWRAKEELNRQLTLLKYARDATLELPCRPPRFWSKWIVALYNWAVRERMATED